MGKARFGLNNNKLKIIAMLSMLLDHVGVDLLPQYEILRVLGRISFPIFAYMIAEGCFYTKNRVKYFVLVAGLGVGCQSVYFIAMRSMYQNILITFALSIALIFCADLCIKRKSIWWGLGTATVLGLIVFLCVILPRLQGTAGDFHINYGLCGVLMPAVIYFIPDRWGKLGAAIGMLVVMAATADGPLQWFGLLAIPLLALYNGHRGKANLKYLFYIFYPAHLAAIYLIGLLIK